MKNKDNILILKSLEYFVKNPYDKIHLREFSRKLKISPNTASRFLNLFLSNGFLKEERTANLRYFKSNTSSLVFKEIKKTFNLYEIEKSGLLEILKLFSFSVVLYGSCAMGLDDKNSDIDILVISKNKTDVINIFYDFECKFSRKINYKIFSPVDWEKQKIANRAFYEDIISFGISLIGEMPL